MWSHPTADFVKNCVVVCHKTIRISISEMLKSCPILCWYRFIVLCWWYTLLTILAGWSSHNSLAFVIRAMRVGNSQPEPTSLIAFRNFSEEPKSPGIWEPDEGASSASASASASAPETASAPRDSLASLYRPPFHLMLHGSFEQVLYKFSCFANCSPAFLPLTSLYCFFCSGKNYFFFSGQMASSQPPVYHGIQLSYG